MILLIQGGTLCNAAKALMDAGALSVDAYNGGVLSGGGIAYCLIAAYLAGNN